MLSKLNGVDYLEKRNYVDINSKTKIIMIDRNAIIDKCIPQIRNDWLAAGDAFPDFLPVISEGTRLANEGFVQSVIDNFQSQMKCFPVNPFVRRKWKRKTQDMIDNALNNESIISIHKYMDQRMIKEFQDELKEFFRHVRKFAPELDLDGIGQAARNYIVYAMFKEIENEKSGFNNACFGYSMLYPFTDNYIDSPNISESEKNEYNRIICDKIEGHEVHPRTLHQKKTCGLLQKIEERYARDIDSSVFILLLMMLEAQENSLHQQNSSILLTEEERLDISLYKGGISVLIDRFFVDKEITGEDLIFYLGFGFFLQLADDLQDINEDSRKGHQTILTVDTEVGHEERIVNKMFHFVRKMMDDYKADNEEFKNFILLNCYQLVYSSIIQSSEFFSEGYLDEMEIHLPVSRRFVQSMKNNRINDIDIKIQEKYMKILDEMI